MNVQIYRQEENCLLKRSAYCRWKADVVEKRVSIPFLEGGAVVVEATRVMSRCLIKTLSKFICDSIDAIAHIEGLLGDGQRLRHKRSI